MSAKRKPRWRCPQCGHLNQHDARKCAECGAVRPWKRAGLHALDCAACGGCVWATVAECEKGLPQCRCGATYQPREVELAELLGLEDAAAVDEYRREVESIWHGQESHASRLDRKLRDPHDVAMGRIVQRRREDARKRRVSALRPVQPAMPF